MASQNQLLQFVLLPHLAQSHMIPMIDMARLLAQHGVRVTIITTPFNAARFKTVIDRAIESGLKIRLIQVPFPAVEAGLPEGCESMDTLPSRSFFKNLLIGISMLQEPAEQILNELQPPPSCIISGKTLAWSNQTANKLQIPRLVFDGTNCFSHLCTNRILATKVHERLSKLEPFVVPGLPDQIVLTKSQLPNDVNMNDAREIRCEIAATAEAAYGEVVNSFEELEPAYINEFRKLRSGKLWCIGPVSLCNKEESDKVERGNMALIEDNQCLKWLDSWAPSCVVYACLGSLTRLPAADLIELGLGLEASKRPFIWVIKGGNGMEEIYKWISEQNFEARINGRGLVIRGWAPQVLILSHPAIGGFLTHCGWNSILEGICAGIPMVTTPLFAEQFYNERFIVQVLEIGVRLRAEFSARRVEETSGILATREEVKKAVEKLMDGGEEGEARRRAAKELQELAKRAVEEGGSSSLNITSLIQDIKQQLTRI